MGEHLRVGPDVGDRGSFERIRVDPLARVNWQRPLVVILRSLPARLNFGVFIFSAAL